jgi:DNA invertase Pin-like site-specific DNA recombinase
MSCCKPHDPEKRKLVIELHRAGKRIVDIAKVAGVTKRTIHRWLNEPIHPNALPYLQSRKR